MYISFHQNSISIKRYIFFFLFLFTLIGNLKAGIKDSVYASILAADIKHPEIVLRQAILETGWFQSKHLMRRNNLFAFRSTKKYMWFNTWQACVKYYKRWQDDNYINLEENYYHFLLRIHYARTPDYIRTLKHVKLTRSEGAAIKTKKPSQ